MGGVIGAVVLVLALCGTVGTIVALNVVDDDETVADPTDTPDTSGTGTPDADPTEAVADPTDDSDDRGGDDRAYAPVSTMCEDLDYGAIEGAFGPLDGNMEVTDEEYTWSHDVECRDSLAGDTGEIWVSASFYDTAADAADEYQATADVFMDGVDRTEAEGDWEQGQEGVPQELTGDADYVVLIQDENLILLVQAYTFSSGQADQDQAPDAVHDIVDQVLTLSSR